MFVVNAADQLALRGDFTVRLAVLERVFDLERAVNVYVDVVVFCGVSEVDA